MHTHATERSHNCNHREKLIEVPSYLLFYFLTVAGVELSSSCLGLLSAGTTGSYHCPQHGRFPHTIKLSSAGQGVQLGGGSAGLVCYLSVKQKYENTVKHRQENPTEVRDT